MFVYSKVLYDQVLDLHRKLEYGLARFLSQQVRSKAAARSSRSLAVPCVLQLTVIAYSWNGLLTGWHAYHIQLQP